MVTGWWTQTPPNNASSQTVPVARASAGCHAASSRLSRTSQSGHLMVPASIIPAGEARRGASSTKRFPHVRVWLSTLLVVCAQLVGFRAAPVSAQRLTSAIARPSTTSTASGASSTAASSKTASPSSMTPSSPSAGSSARTSGVAATGAATRLAAKGSTVSATAATAADGAIDPTLKQALQRRGDLTLRDVSLGEALLAIGQQWDVSLVVSDDVEGSVSGSFVAAPLGEILDAVLLSNGYSYRPVGRTLVVLPLEKLGDFNPLFESAVIRVERGEPAELLEGARLLTSPKGKVEAIEAARSLLVVDYPDRVARIRRFVEDVNRIAARQVAQSTSTGPQPLEVLELRPQYVVPTALEAAVKSLLSEDGKASIVEGEDLIVVTDYPERLDNIRRTVQRLDVPRRQVRIVSLIYDIDLEDIENLGINWSSDVKGRYDGDGNPQSIFSADTLLKAAPLPGNPDGAFTFFNISRHFDLNTIVRALHQSKYSRLLADPSVTVVENEKALMSIVEEIPYQQLTQTSAGGNIGTTAFREAGVKLEVTPRIADDGTIEMQVTPSFSRLTGFTPGDNPQPIIDKREANTVVRVANGQTLVIGGLRTRQDIRNRDGIPFLKDIRTFHLGALFRGRELQTRESELVVFLRPEIVGVVCSGTAREMHANNVSNVLLDRIPAASVGPYQCDPLPPVDEGEVIIESETIDHPLPPAETIDAPAGVGPENPAPSAVDPRPAAPTRPAVPTGPIGRETAVPPSGNPRRSASKAPVRSPLLRPASALPDASAADAVREESAVGPSAAPPALPSVPSASSAAPETAPGSRPARPHVSQQPASQPRTAFVPAMQDRAFPPNRWLERGRDSIPRASQNRAMPGDRRPSRTARLPGVSRMGPSRLTMGPAPPTRARPSRPTPTQQAPARPVPTRPMQTQPAFDASPVVGSPRTTTNPPDPTAFRQPSGFGPPSAASESEAVAPPPAAPHAPGKAATGTTRNEFLNRMFRR